MNLNPVSFFDRIGAPYRMRSWGDPIRASYTDISKCIEIEDYLRKRCNISPHTPIWNRQNIDELIRKVKRRKLRYGMYNVLAKTIPVLSLISFLSFLTEGYTGALYLSLSILPLSAVFWLMRNRNSRTKKPMSCQDFFSDVLSPEEKTKLVTEIDTLENKPSQFFWVGNHNELFGIPDDALTAENWFLLLTGIEKDRKGLLLKDRIPTGKIVILSPENKRTRNSRFFEIQKARMSTSSKTKNLYDEIRKKTSNGHKLNIEKQVRLDAMLFASENPEFWDGIREDTNLINEEKYSRHRILLNKIFKPATRPKTTMSDNAGSNMMYTFVELEDRTLENWLRELNIKPG